MVKNHTHHSFEPKYLVDYRLLEILNENTLLLVTPNGREVKTHINDVKPATKLTLAEYAWNSFLNLIKTKHENCDYSLRLHS